MSDLLNQLTSHLLLSPASIVEPTMDLIDEVYAGQYDISDANSPWIKLLECSATHAAAAQINANTLTRRQYPKLAETYEDLYYHMSDSDYLGRFSTPNSNAVVWWAAPVNDIIEQAILDPSIGLKKLTIPADTTYRISNYDLFQHWPVDIVVSADERLSARFDLSKETKIKTRDSNTISFNTTVINGEDYFLVGIEVDQLTPKTTTIPINPALSASTSVNFTDMFYAARVFYSTNESDWIELPVTHSDQTFDPNVPTALLTVREGAVDVRIPDIYVRSGKVSGTLKTMVLTTKGYTELALSSFSSQEWSARYNDFNDLTRTWSDNLSKIKTYLIFGRDTFKGGKGEKTFTEMKNQVVYNLYDKAAPISEDELRAELDKIGFRVSKQRDSILGRTFVASSSLPSPDDKANLTSPAGMVNADITIDDMRTDLSRSIKKTDKFTVLRPNSMFKGEFGAYSILNDSDKVQIESLELRQLAEELNEGDYYYNPFHYVLDSSEPIFDARAYYLQEPREYARSYVADNPALGFSVATNSVNVELDIETDTYTLVLNTSAPNNGDAVLAVINLTDPVTGQKWDKTATSTLVADGVYEYRFTLNSDFDIDSSGNFTLNGLVGDSPDVSPRVSISDTIFDLVYVIPGDTTSSFDSILARKELTIQASAITYEQVTIKWGQHLDYLYVKTRAISNPPVFELRESDKLAYYDKDIYLTDETGIVLEPNDFGDLEPVVLFEAGDVMYEEDGTTPIYLWRKGDVVRDPETNAPVELEPETVIREVRIVMIDAALGFSDTETSITYRKSLPSFMTSKNDNEIKNFNSRLLEETDLFYEPIATQVSARVEVEQGKERVLSSALQWKIRIQLFESSYKNDGIRDNIRRAIRSVLSELSEGREISVSKVYDNLTKLSPQDIRSIKVDSPFGTSDIATLLDDNAKWSIASIAVPLSNGSLEVQDAIEFEWIK